MKRFTAVMLSVILCFSVAPTWAGASQPEAGAALIDGDDVADTGSDGADIANDADGDDTSVAQEAYDSADLSETGDTAEQENRAEYADEYDIMTVSEEEDPAEDGDAAEEEYTAEIEWTNLSLALSYDDRYSLGDIQAVSAAVAVNGDYTILDITDNKPTSYQVEKGKKTSAKDTDTVSIISEDNMDIRAAGVGTATILLVPSAQKEAAKSILSGEEPGLEEDITIPGFEVSVTVKAAPLTLMFMAGQSSMEGRCSDNTGYQLERSVSCTEGTVYSTYAPTKSSIAESITGIKFSTMCTADNAGDFVAGSLAAGTNMSGGSLAYPIDSLTAAGGGKSGMDSGLAWEWNQKTGDKVWVVNTAWSGTSIKKWVPGGTYYDRSAAVWKNVLQTYQAEIAAGHYTAGKKLLFWFHGGADNSMTAVQYESYFSTMYNSMKGALGLDAVGIIMIRGAAGTSYTDETDISMTGPRMAQYYITATYSDVYLVSRVNEQWVSDSGVKSYFSSAYPGGSLTYPIHSEETLPLPTTVAEVHNDIHYSQIAHNENAITAADGMYASLYGSGIANPFGNYTGIYHYLEWEWVYLKKGVIQIDMQDLKQDSDGVWYYINGGKVDFSYTGLVQNQTSKNWWYAENGKITKKYTGFAQNKDSGNWWYVQNSRVTKKYTGFAQNQDSGNWWYVQKSRVTKKYTGFKQNKVSKKWWYVQKSRVTMKYTGFKQNKKSGKWWYVQKSRVTMKYTGIVKGKVNGKSGSWYVKNSRVMTDFTGSVKINGKTYRVIKGKVQN